MRFMSRRAEDAETGPGIRWLAGRFLAASILFPLLAGAAAANDTIKIGIIAGLTGPGATYGQGIRQGAEMTVEEINGAGGLNGRRVELVMVDDTTNPTRSIVAMQRLMYERIAIVVGGWGSSQVLAHMRIPELRQIPYIVVGATHPAVTNPAHSWIFRVIQTDAVQAEELAGLATQRIRPGRFVVINDASEYGTGNRDIFVTALRRRGIEPLAIRSYESHSEDFRTLVGAAPLREATAIALFGTVPAAPRLMAQLRAAGVTATFFGTGGLANESLISMSGQSSEGTILTTYFNERSDPGSEEWASRFAARFAASRDAPRPVLAAWQYRAIRYIAAPCLAATETSEQLRDCIKAWRGRLFGLPDEAYFDDSGQLVQKSVIVEVRGGRFEPIR